MKQSDIPQDVQRLMTTVFDGIRDLAAQKAAKNFDAAGEQIRAQIKQGQTAMSWARDAFGADDLDEAVVNLRSALEHINNGRELAGLAKLEA